jgi:hypothetical protein
LNRHAATGDKQLVAKDLYEIGKQQPHAPVVKAGAKQYPPLFSTVVAGVITHYIWDGR